MIHKLVYKHGSASPEDRGHLQAPVSPRERCTFMLHLNWITQIQHLNWPVNTWWQVNLDPDDGKSRLASQTARKREISRDFSRFFDPAFFSEFHRSLLPFSMLCPDSDSRKGLFCVFPKAIDSVAGFGLAKAEPDSAKKPPLHKLFTNTIDPFSNCLDLNSRN